MLLSCPVCDAHYKLDDTRVFPIGKRVRCGDCSHVWRVEPPKVEIPAQEDARNKFAFSESAISLDDGPTEIDYSKPAGGADVPSFVMPEVTVAEPVQKRAAFKDHLPEMPVTEYMPMGLSANRFGAMVFLLPLLLTLCVLVGFRETLAKRIPALGPVYAAAGIPAPAPGDGLRLSALQVTREIEKDKKTLMVEARIANISGKTRDYPALELILTGSEGSILKTWLLKKPVDEQGSVRKLEKGEEAPIKAAFNDAPEGAMSAVLKVVEK